MQKQQKQNKKSKVDYEKVFSKYDNKLNQLLELDEVLCHSYSIIDNKIHQKGDQLTLTYNIHDKILFEEDVLRLEGKQQKIQLKPVSHFLSKVENEFHSELPTLKYESISAQIKRLERLNPTLCFSVLESWSSALNELRDYIEDVKERMCKEIELSSNVKKKMKMEDEEDFAGFRGLEGKDKLSFEHYAF